MALFTARSPEAATLNSSSPPAQDGIGPNASGNVKAKYDHEGFQLATILTGTCLTCPLEAYSDITGIDEKGHEVGVEFGSGTFEREDASEADKCDVIVCWRDT
jgi:hypothetical protein